MPLEYDTDSLFIGGRWSAGTGRPRTTWVAPSTEEIYGRSVQPTEADADAAVTAARQAFREGAWRERSVRERGEVLRRAAAIIQPQVPEIAITSAYEIGAPLGMRDVYVHHWSRAEGDIERGRERTEYRLADRNERGEMYRLIDEFRAARGLPAS